MSPRLRCVTAQDFAVILLDVRMPIMDGIETAALIRQRRQSEMTPIIFITAHASDELVHTDRYAQGAVDFIFAPVPPDELRAKVSVFANLFSKAEELAAKAERCSVSRPAETPHRRRTHRHLPDRRREPLRLHQPALVRDHRHRRPTRRRASSGTSIVASAEHAGLDRGTARRRDLTTASSAIASRSTSRSSASRIVLVISKAIPATDGGIAGWVGTLADVTAETGAEAALSMARDEANEASRLKSDFLANMSHEIRTPMNGVIGMTDLLLETDLDARQRDYAQTVRNSGESLLTIIDDILDFSKVEAGKLEIEQIEFNLRTVVDDVVDLLAGSAQAKGLELRRGRRQLACRRSSAATRAGYARSLTNLIGNAIKFTETGESSSGWHRPGSEGDDTVVRFDVSDTGNGIAPDKLELIFQPFVQADTSTSRKYGGTGLGLAISGQLVGLMGGDSGVTSTLGEGSNFWFTIRVHAKTDSAAHDPGDAGLSGVVALIVADNATLRRVLAEKMTEWEHDRNLGQLGRGGIDGVARRPRASASPLRSPSSTGRCRVSTGWSSRAQSPPIRHWRRASC